MKHSRLLHFVFQITLASSTSHKISRDSVSKTTADEIARKSNYNTISATSRLAEEAQFDDSIPEHSENGTKRNESSLISDDRNNNTAVKECNKAESCANCTKMSHQLNSTSDSQWSCLWKGEEDVCYASSTMGHYNGQKQHRCDSIDICHEANSCAECRSKAYEVYFTSDADYSCHWNKRADDNKWTCSPYKGKSDDEQPCVNVTAVHDKYVTCGDVKSDASCTEKSYRMFYISDKRYTCVWNEDENKCHKTHHCDKITNCADCVSDSVHHRCEWNIRTQQCQNHGCYNCSLATNLEKCTATNFRDLKYMCFRATTNAQCESSAFFVYAKQISFLTYSRDFTFRNVTPRNSQEEDEEEDGCPETDKGEFVYSCAWEAPGTCHVKLFRSMGGNCSVASDFFQVFDKVWSSTVIISIIVFVLGIGISVVYCCWLIKRGRSHDSRLREIQEF